jgi:organic hydroperoxide reductase OsmC/OhrA
MSKLHHYQLNLKWTGNTGSGTSGYKSYERSHAITAEDKPVILTSSDPAFRGDPSRYNPEELFLASIASCHMLWYLHLCATNGVMVTAYEDNPTGVMTEEADGSGRFRQVTLHPSITVVAADMIKVADELHAKANQYCYIANSLNLPVHHEPSYTVANV